METRAHHALIGVFTLGVLVLGFVFVWWFAGSSEYAKRQAFRILFEGSVSGLTNGSSVLFNGIKVGEVSKLELDAKEPRKVMANIAVSTDTVMRADTKARLESQGLTGVAVVALLGGAPDAPPLRSPEDGGPPVIVAESSAVQDLMEGARNVLARADGVMKTVEAVVSDNRAEISKVITNVRVFTDALAKNSNQVSAFLEGMGTAARQVGSLADRLQGFVSEVEEVVKAIDVHGVRETVNNTRDFTASLAKIGPRMDKLFEDAPVLSQTLRQAAARLDTVLASAQTIIGRVDPDKVGKAVDNVTAFSDTLNQNRQNVDDVVRHARELAQRVNEGSKRLDSILSKTDALLGNANDTGLMEEVRKAAQSIQTLADNLDKRAGEISIGLNRFSNQGLRELELLISNGRSTLSDVDQVVRDFQRSPSQFLFGKSGIPDYSRGR